MFDPPAGVAESLGADASSLHFLECLLVEVEDESVGAITNSVRFNLNAALECLLKHGSEV